MAEDTERQVSVVEAPVFSTAAGRRFFLANEEDRQELSALFPQYIVRLARADEIDGLQGKTWEEMEREQIEHAVKTQR